MPTGDDLAAAAPDSGTPVFPKLIVGLGNPGSDYRDTRHNIGFMVVDELARRLGVTFAEEKRWHGLLAKFAGGHLLKPQTFMNESGRSVLAVAQFFKIPTAKTLVVYDDLDLPVGRIRLRQSGSAAGHNGIRSLIRTLGTDAFPRLKLGVSGASGRPAGDRVTGHVLGRFQPAEQPDVDAMIQRGVEAILTALHSGLEHAMNLFNRKDPA